MRCWLLQEKRKPNILLSGVAQFCMATRFFKRIAADLYSHSLRFGPKLLCNSHLAKHSQTHTLNFLQSLQKPLYFLLSTGSWDLLHVIVYVVIFVDVLSANWLNELFYKTHNFVVVDQLVDSAELEDDERSNNLHRCLRLESRIVILCNVPVKQKSSWNTLRSQDTTCRQGNCFRTLQLIRVRDWYMTATWNAS